jgi:hypothetical protein
MSPFGACLARVGMLNGTPGEPGVPGVPSVIKTSPEVACRVTVWSPVSQTNSSSSAFIQRPCGDENVLPQSVR